MRRIKSVKDELIKKSREAILAAVQVYNNPNITFKTETFITLAVIGWTYLLHAFYRSKKIDYRYFEKKNKRKHFDLTKYKAYKHWELERCLNEQSCPLDKETISNLKFIIGLRHEIEHQMTNRIDEFISAKIQACAINFNFYIKKIFGDKYGLNKEISLNIQFSPITPEQQEILIGNTYLTNNVKNFIAEFENDLSEDALKNSKYACRIMLMPIAVNRKGQADKVIEFIKADSPLAQEVEKSYALIKETEKIKYLPSEIVEKIKNNGYDLFSINKHTEIWKSEHAKDINKGFGVQVSKTWYWYDTWLQHLLNYCNKHKDTLKSNKGN